MEITIAFPLDSSYCRRMIYRFSLLALLFLALSIPVVAKPNLILILSDDHRYDFMGFHEQAPDFLETPNLDQLAAEGAHLANAFVSTSLCSPSRASILTGQYMHHHRVVDNQRPVPDGTVFFPQLLQRAGYETAFIGKWHMGHDNDEPRPGFDYWASFKGQGTYQNPLININGTRKPFQGYNADVLAGLALDWLKRPHEKPIFLMLSFKAVHYPFQPPARHHGRYQDRKIDTPETMALTEDNYRTQPRWVRERRYGIHGIDHMETGALDKDPVPDFKDLYWRFCETVHALDEAVGRVMDRVRATDRQDTLVLYMGDNGFALGEHGFYDKRDAFEVSIRVPMLAWGPGRIAPKTTIEAMVQNIDVAATFLEAAGVECPKNFDGQSFYPWLTGKPPDTWRKHVLYEYHWEWNFPAQPTTLAIRTDRWKYVYTHGHWDIDGLYDLQTDPIERHNLIEVPAFREQAEKLRGQLFEEFGASGGLVLPIRPPKGDPYHDRKLRR